jgi:hypothetical protein
MISRPAAGPDGSRAQLHTVRYAFDAAFLRFRQATDDDWWMAELSNMLHHLYRLRMVCIDRLPGFEQQIEPSLKHERGRAGRGTLTRTSCSGLLRGSSRR